MKYNVKPGLVYAIIPARSGSKGVVDKNIRMLGGYPVIAYSIRAALKAATVSRVVVSTDSERYARMSRCFGAEVPFLRPACLSKDDSADIDFFHHAIDWFNENDGVLPEYIVHLRPTTPLRSPKVIDEAVEYFVCSNNSALRSAHRMSESAYKAFEIKGGIFTRLCGAGNDLDSSNLGRQQYPCTYDANGYVDVLRTSFIVEHNKIHGDNVLAFETKRSFEIDEESDIGFLEYQLRSDFSIVEELFGND